MDWLVVDRRRLAMLLVGFKSLMALLVDNGMPRTLTADKETLRMTLVENEKLIVLLGNMRLEGVNLVMRLRRTSKRLLIKRVRQNMLLGCVSQNWPIESAS